jgi:tetratricopeptide (TPR) repeat protein
LYQAAQAARRARDRRSESRIDVNIGFASIQLGLYSQARTALEEGMELAEAIGERDLASIHADNLSYAYWCMGDQEQAIALDEQALLDFKKGIHRPYGEAACLAQLGFYLAEKGNWDSAFVLLEEACRKFTGLGNKLDTLEQQALKARCLLALGRHEEARQQATEAWSHLDAHGSIGINFPVRMYCNIAEVFAVLESPPVPAGEVIEAGYRDLMQSAEKISDAEWRKSFLANVAEHRQIVERWKNLNPKG